MLDKTLTTIDISGLTGERDLQAFDYTDPFGQPATGFVVRWKGELVAYRNLCPHWAVPIDHEGSFFDETGRLLMCHHHGARFDPGSGECTFGPPHGQRLEGFDVVVLEDGVHAEIRRRSGLILSF